MKNVGNHTVRGIAPGRQFPDMSEGEARLLAQQGHITWADFITAHVERRPKVEKTPTRKPNRKAD